MSLFFRRSEERAIPTWPWATGAITDPKGLGMPRSAWFRSMRQFG